MALEVHTGETLTVHVEIDGAYFGGTIRAENHKADRKDRRLKEHQNGPRRVVVVMRERLGRTLPVVTMAEAEGVALVQIPQPPLTLHQPCLLHLVQRLPCALVDSLRPDLWPSWGNERGNLRVSL